MRGSLVNPSLSMCSSSHSQEPRLTQTSCLNCVVPKQCQSLFSGLQLFMQSSHSPVPLWLASYTLMPNPKPQLRLLAPQTSA